MPRVHYRREVSDGILKTVLENIAASLARDVKVTSGDRGHVPPGGSQTSLHLLKQAADLHVEGLDDWTAFISIRTKYQEIFVPGHVYEMILHGQYTGTDGAHVHLGRYPDERMKTGVAAEIRGKAKPIHAKNGLLVRIEGVEKSEKKKYTTMEYLEFGAVEDAPAAPEAKGGGKPSAPEKPTGSEKPTAPEKPAKTEPPEKPERPTRDIA